jgi:hypothetical protein
MSAFVSIFAEGGGAPNEKKEEKGEKRENVGD